MCVIRAPLAGGERGAHHASTMRDQWAREDAVDQLVVHPTADCSQQHLAVAEPREVAFADVRQLLRDQGEGRPREALPNCAA